MYEISLLFSKKTVKSGSKDQKMETRGAKGNNFDTD